MRVWISALVLSAILALSPSQADAQQDIFYAGDWEGWASYDDASGRFEFCAVTAEYQNGITLGFGLNPEFGLIVMMWAPHWDVPDGSEFALSLSVDRKWSRTVQASAFDGTGIFAMLAEDYDAFEALRRGRQLTVGAHRESFYFELAGSSRALLETARCVFDHTETASRSDPFSLGADPFSGGSVASREESTAGVDENAVAALLMVSGLDAAVLLSPSERSALFPNVLHAWEIGSIFGVYADAPRNGRAPEEIVAGEVAILAQGCDGRFASGFKPSEPIGGLTVRRFFTSCDGASESFATSGTVLIGATDVGLIEHVGTWEDRVAVSDVDDRLAAGLASVMRY